MILIVETREECSIWAATLLHTLRLQQCAGACCLTFNLNNYNFLLSNIWEVCSILQNVLIRAFQFYRHFQVHTLLQKCFETSMYVLVLVFYVHCTIQSRACYRWLKSLFCCQNIMVLSNNESVLKELNEVSTIPSNGSWRRTTWRCIGQSGQIRCIRGQEVYVGVKKIMIDIILANGYSATTQYL